mmetsp:Transcript_34037/g.101109  ORF Transcript_34037/g.101109 Transcript_34037/m.101109 type:complete len:213 (+) Transcript_34037:52-690(+)
MKPYTPNRLSASGSGHAFAPAGPSRAGPGARAQPPLPEDYQAGPGTPGSSADPRWNVSQDQGFLSQRPPANDIMSEEQFRAQAHMQFGRELAGLKKMVAKMECLWLATAPLGVTQLPKLHQDCTADHRGTAGESRSLSVPATRLSQGSSPDHGDDLQRISSNQQRKLGAQANVNRCDYAEQIHALGARRLQAAVASVTQRASVMETMQKARS